MVPTERLLSEQEWARVAEKIARDRDPLAATARDVSYEALAAAIGPVSRGTGRGGAPARVDHPGARRLASRPAELSRIRKSTAS